MLGKAACGYSAHAVDTLYGCFKESIYFEVLAVVHGAVKEDIGSGAVLWSCCAAMLGVGANSTAIMSALPAMRQDLLLTPGGVQWAINAYLIVSAIFIVLGGRTADRIGARLASIIGLALFAVASSIIALSGAQAPLLVGRALQGLAAAIAVPSTLAVVNASGTEARQAGAIGAWTGFLMLGFSIGPFVGGALTHVTGWRAIFWFNIPLMVAATVGLFSGPRASAPLRLLESGESDWLGFILLAAVMISLIFALHALPDIWVVPATLVSLSGSAFIAFLLLLRVERRASAPLVDLSFFGRPGFLTGVAVGGLSMFSIMSLLLYFNLFAQSPDGLGLTPLGAGTVLLPLSWAQLVLALSASAVAARVGIRNAVRGGMTLVVAGTILIGMGAVYERTFVLLTMGLLVMGAGLALPYALAPRLALSSLAPAKAGQGSGIINACTFLGGSCGVAGGAIAFSAGGISAILLMIAVAGVIGVIFSQWIPNGLRRAPEASPEP